MNQTEPDLNNWNDFHGKFFKVDHVKSWPAIAVPTIVNGNFDEELEAQLTYEIQYDGKKLKWNPNKTNIGIIKAAGIPSPKALLGKKLYFKQVMNFNPQLKKKVPALELEKIE